MERIALVGGLFGVAVVCALVLGWRRRRERGVSPSREGRAGDLERRATERLSEALSPGVGTHLEAPAVVETVAVVTDAEDRTAFVPVVRVDLHTNEAPGMALIFEFVAPVLEALAPVFADDRVHHYDVRFTYGPSGLLVSGACRRVTVTPEIAARLEDPSYRAFDLRRDVERGDDGSERSPVLWGECVAY